MHFYTQTYMDYNKMHPTFWNSLTLIDHNFGTKSPFDLKQKALLSSDFAVVYYAIISVLVGELNFGIQASYTPLNFNPYFSLNAK